jgi:hypothetical protein
VGSMRRLDRRLARWHRYAKRTYWGRRYTRPRWTLTATLPPGHTRAWNAREKERERRQCLVFHIATCLNCGLPDLHGGQGDGIGSCECPRCYSCGAPPEVCGCAWTEDDWGDDPDDGCPCGADCGCWDEPLERPMETVDTGGLL